MILIEVRRLAIEMSVTGFAGTTLWCERFMRRNGLCMCTKTTIAHKLPRKYERKIIEFHKYVINVRKKLCFETGQLRNMDKFGSDAWVLKKREEQRLEAAQMKFLRYLLGITKLDKEKDQCIREKMGPQNTVKEIKQYQKKWLQNVQRMNRNRLPRQALKYRPEGRRNIGRPKKRWRDQLHFED